MVITPKTKKIRILVTKTLRELGMPSHIKGYRYIREGIMIVYNSLEEISITKKIYPSIAATFDTTAFGVERAIRHAIEVSWSRGNWRLIENIFGYSIDINKSKPTNSEFIFTIADDLKLNNRM